MLEDSAVPVILTQERIADELPVAAMTVRLDADWAGIDRFVRVGDPAPSIERTCVRSFEIMRWPNAACYQAVAVL